MEWDINLPKAHASAWKAAEFSDPLFIFPLSSPLSASELGSQLLEMKYRQAPDVTASHS